MFEHDEVLENEVLLDEEVLEEDMMDMEEDGNLLGKPVHLVLDDGNEMDTIIIAVFAVDNVEWDYIALLPVPDNKEEDAENNDVLLYRFAVEEDGTPVLGNIESDAEYEAAAMAFSEELDMYEEESMDMDLPFGEE